MKRGFTLIELIVVIGILSGLISLFVLYSRDSERQLKLIREQARLISAVLRTKALSVQTFKSGEASCGYGVNFSTNAYRIFKEPKAADGSCANNKAWGDATDIEVESVNLSDTGVTLSTSPSMTDVFFTPPDPKVLLSPGNLSQSVITLSVTIAGSASTRAVTINNGGQISE